MGATNSSNKNVKYYQLKAKADETNTPHFALSEKKDGKWVVSQTFDTIEGFLTSAEIKEKEYNGAKSNIFILVMEDNSERMQIEMTHNGVTHSIINSLASNTNKMSTYTLKVYKKPNNGKFWGAVSAKIDGEQLSWSVDPKTAPKKDPVMVNGQPFMQNGKQVYDDSKLRAFYETMFKDKVIANLGGIKENSTDSSDAVTDVNPITDTPHGDLPF